MATKKRYKNLTDDEIKSAIDVHVQDSVNYKDSSLAAERKQVLDYYHGRLPKRQHNGNSQYVSMDVYDTVESMKAGLLELFATGPSIIDFPPQGREDVEPARIAGLYTDYVLFRQNDGYKIFSDAIHDGLTARIGVAKVYWDKWTDEVEEEFEGALPEQMDQLIADPEVELKEYAFDEATQTLSGTICRYIKRGQVRIDNIPPEDVLVSARETSHTDPKFIAHRSTRMAGELLNFGLTQEEIDAIPSDSIDPIKDQAVAARTDNLSLNGSASEREHQQQVRPIDVLECYVKLDVEGTGKPKLWKFLKAGDHILDREEVDRHPFKFFIPLPVPHAFLGSNFANKVVPIQNARTTLIRGILDHTVITNNPRTVVVKGALVNPRELMENRQGGLVNVTRPDGVFPYPQSSLNPFVFQTIGLLDEDKEDTTGISKLSQGLNRDAVSNQNSQGLVENLVGLSQQRQKIIARNFANGFLIPLAIEAYRLVLENEDRKNIIELAGNWVEVDPRTWIERKDATCVLKLGYGEQAKEVGKWLAVHKLLGSDPSMAPMYAAEQRYNVIKKALEADGVRNIDDIMISPTDQVRFKPPEPDPKYIAEIDRLKAETAALQQKLQLQAAEFDWQKKLDIANQELAKKEAMLEHVMQLRQEERRDFESKARAATAERELNIIETAEPQKVTQSNIISPNS